MRVLVISGDGLTLAGLEACFGDQERWVVSSFERNGDGILDRAVTFRPDVVVWDLGWAETDFARLEASLASLPATVVLVTSSEDLARAWAAGASGVLHRSAAAERLQAATLAVAEGLWVSDLQLPVTALDDLDPGPRPQMLTPREAQVLACLARGLTNKAISQELQVTEHTVKFHVRAILRKLDAESRTEAVMRAARHGLIPL